jgi:hypothetical protein
LRCCGLKAGTPVVQQVTEQAQVAGVSEGKPVELRLPEPADGVVLFRLQVGDGAPQRELQKELKTCS